MANSSINFLIVHFSSASFKPTAETQPNGHKPSEVMNRNDFYLMTPEPFRDSAAVCPLPLYASFVAAMISFTPALNPAS